MSAFLSHIVSLIWILFLFTGELYGQTRSEFLYVPSQSGTSSIEDDEKIRSVTLRTNPEIVRGNLGYMVNTRYEELNPIISADGQTLYFARKNSPQNIGGKQDPQDIWFTTYNGNTWSKSKNLGSQINSAGADNLCAVSPDNNTMYFFVKKGNDKGSFTFRTRTPTGWSGIQDLGLNVTNESAFLESCLSPDGNVLLFTARTKKNVAYRKTVDERDIYVSVRLSRGIWSRPENIGAKINTAGDEYSPFLAADGRTLYFATNGRPGYGGVDVFMARRIGQGWSEWTEPLNLGERINTPGNDAYFTIAASGGFAFLASDHQSAGRSDIVRISVPEHMRPAPMIMATGFTLDSLSLTAIDTRLTFHLSADKISFTQLTNKSNGNFTVMLLPGERYKVRVEADGYFPLSKIIEAHPPGINQSMKIDFLLSPIVVGKKFPLKNTFFDQGKSTLKTEFMTDLESLVELMRRYPAMRIEILGHTDNRGPIQQLNILAQARANTIADYLIERGIQKTRIERTSCGPTEPVADNHSEESRAKNRRVEFRILQY